MESPAPDKPIKKKRRIWPLILFLMCFLAAVAAGAGAGSGAVWPQAARNRAMTAAIAAEMKAIVFFFIVMLLPFVIYR